MVKACIALLNKYVDGVAADVINRII